MRAGARLAPLLIAAIACTTIPPSTALASTGPVPALLAVPYLAQPEALCGGAAVAMVMRYWGDDDVQASDFAALLDREAAGIHADELTLSVKRRGWQAHAIAGARAPSAVVQQHLSRGRPVVTLIEVAPHRYHYVVIVGWTAERVVFHDPAREPYRQMPVDDFQRAWAAAEHWALLIVPGDDEAPDIRGDAPAVPVEPASARRASARPASAPPTRCAALVSNGVDRAKAGDLAAAEAQLVQATVTCPAEATGWRELAGVRFRERRWRDASTLAERALGIEPDDGYGWRLLASSRFLDSDPLGALDAWNRVGEPVIGDVSVSGLRRTRQPVVRRAAGLEPRSRLDSDSLLRARHRVAALPSVKGSRVDYSVGESGRAEVAIVAHEADTLPRGLWPLVALGGQALLGREVRLDVASPTGSGEVWSGAWRFWPSRPRVAFGLALPSPSPLPGVTVLDLSWERQTYGGIGVREVREGHRRAGLLVSDWATGRLRWEGGASVEGWTDRRHVGATGGLDLRLARDRVALTARGSAYAPGTGHPGFVTAALAAAWRSVAAPSSSRWLARAGVESASGPTPLDLWPGAGAGHARTAYLRAHPLLSGGVLDGKVFGRRVAHAGVEYRHAIFRGPFAVDLAAFSDTARAWARRAGDRSALHVDVGFGFRASAPGVGGTVRLDFAKGLRDGAFAVSAGWAPEWPF